MRRDDIRNLAIIAHVDHFTREEGGNPEDPRFIFVDHPILFAILLRRSWAITAMMIFHLDG